MAEEITERWVLYDCELRRMIEDAARIHGNLKTKEVGIYVVGSYTGCSKSQKGGFEGELGVKNLGLEV
jgi:hypothetical protein